MIIEAQRAVCEFNKAFNLPISESPKLLERDRVLLRGKWMKEEVDEFFDATDIVDQVDAIIDLMYFALGALVGMGVDGDEAFRLIHEANMAKLGNDGKPIYNEEGKVIKPEGWVSPKESIRQWLSNTAKA
jgi:predicted HAD superfamily Cof-like phosphohydrolase